MPHTVYNGLKARLLYVRAAVSVRRCGCGRNGSACVIIISFVAGIIAAKFFPYSLLIILAVILLCLSAPPHEAFGDGG